MSEDDILERILTFKRHEVAKKKSITPIKELETLTRSVKPPRDLITALKKPEIALIAEIKRKSPSKGILRENFNPASLARTYVTNGAHAISVIADKEFFGGGPDLVKLVSSLPEVTIPILFKEFILDPYQVVEARASGADALLLIVRSLSPERLKELIDCSRQWGMEPLVETFTLEDARMATQCGAKVIGINNRDLKTFTVDIERSRRIREELPYDIVAVSESGLHSHDDMLLIKKMGFQAALVGEAIITAPNVGAKIQEFLGRGTIHDHDAPPPQAFRGP